MSNMAVARLVICVNGIRFASLHFGLPQTQQREVFRPQQRKRLPENARLVFR